MIGPTRISSRRLRFSAPLLIGILGLALSCHFASRGFHLNSPFLFWVCTFSIVVFSVLLAYRTGLRRWWLFPVTANCVAVFTVGLALAEVGVWIGGRFSESASVMTAYSFDKANGDPKAFRQWLNRFNTEWNAIDNVLLRPDPDGVLPFVLSPNCSVPFLKGSITTNSMGFRNKEFNIDKNGAYRIVTIGESTTMGLTVEKDDIPWPVVLERIIRSQIPGDKRFEVINAGVAAYDLKHNIRRVKTRILPLGPDMIISYHGYNGFRYIIDSLPPVCGSVVPLLNNSRPSYLLASLDYAIRAWAFRQKLEGDASPVVERISDESLLQTEYAKLYSELISIAQTNDIALVICSFNMAVNDKSPKDVISYYQECQPQIHRTMIANALHTRLLQLMGRSSRFQYIYSGERLDGSYKGSYFDLVHFTQKGRERLAMNIFKEIKPALTQEAAPDPRASNRARIGHPEDTPDQRITCSPRHHGLVSR